MSYHTINTFSAMTVVDGKNKFTKRKTKNKKQTNKKTTYELQGIFL